jgi:hypothetical protein
MITVACVKWGAKYPARYANVLRAAVARHLARPHRFVCLTDDPSGLDAGIEARALSPGRVGWWNKLELFRPGQFEGRVLYLDLDSVIVGDLAPLAARCGIVWLDDWGWRRRVYGSGTMVWDAGEHADAWNDYTPEVAARLEGDQDWLTELGGWARLLPPLVRSYRYHCRGGPPPGCVVVGFHGAPKPHEVRGGWVPQHWRG